MQEDGWQTSEFLPEDWRFKRDAKAAGISILTGEMEQLGSYLAAIKHLEGDEKYGPRDVENINLLLAENTERVSLKTEDCEASPLPPGWRMRVCGSQSYVVSPAGLQFRNKRKALQHMILEQCPQEQVSTMRQAMGDEGWKVSEYLPENWRTKQTNIGSKNVKVQLLSDRGELLNSYLAAIAVMEQDFRFTKQDMENVNMLLAENSKTSRLSQGSEETGKHPTPEGWMIRVCGKHR